jgi:fatty acid amide hydrolase
MSVSARADQELVYQNAVELARLIAAGEVSAREVVDAHIERVEAVNPKLNAVVVSRFEEARREAEAVDADRARGAALGPLAGVPITVKECFYIAGTQATIGVGRFVGKLSTHDSPQVARLRSAGAVVLGKTNIPQAMLMHETDNPVYGRTNNPWNLNRGPGGSSGGEAAIVAAGGSALGLGNDLGGSIRQPAHSCGLFGLKPTTGRLSNADSFENLHGMEAVGVQPGPLARSVDDIELAYRLLATPSWEAVDYQTPPVPVGDAGRVAVDHLRIGYWADDRYFHPAPAIRRAVEVAAGALREAGATVEAIDPPDMRHAMALYLGLLSADGGAELKTLIGSSERDWRVKWLERLGGLAWPVRTPLAAALRTAGQASLADLLRDTGPRDGKEGWRLTHERRLYTQGFMNRLREKGIDAWITPVHPLPALTHGSTAWLATAGSYCMLGNLLGAPSGVVPVCRVRPGEESDRPTSGDLVEKAARAVEQGSAGLPVGVQVSAPHWREDIVLAVMRALEERLPQRDDYPRRPNL